MAPIAKVMMDVEEKIALEPRLMTMEMTKVSMRISGSIRELVVTSSMAMQYEDKRLHQGVGGDEQYGYDHYARDDEINPDFVEHRLVKCVGLLGHTAGGVIVFAHHIFENFDYLAVGFDSLRRGRGIFEGDEDCPVVRGAFGFVVDDFAVYHPGRGRVGENAVNGLEIFAELSVFVGFVHAEFEQHFHHIRPNGTCHAPNTPASTSPCMLKFCERKS